ncbi:MAG: NAD-binding protein [Candidatus Margulisiibacteriota bacterium]|nr:NAD-binding protein [Candidatus Margulisiibacteriota bacterium]MBU1871139.1 NAD-binding protein [Patescibacteria group bacterium]
MYIVIVGGGKVGTFMAKALSSRKHDIVLIEKDEKRAQKVAEDLDKILVICGDGCDPHVLEDAHAEKARVLVTVTGDDEDNLIISQLAKDTFKVPRAIARINNPRNEQTFQMLGIDAISSTTIISKLIEEEATIGEIKTLLSLKRGKLAIVEMTLTPDSPATGKKVLDLKMPEESIIASIIRDEKIVFPRGNTVLFPGDSIIVLTQSDKEKDVKKVFMVK